jgi:hypothetical protein
MRTILFLALSLIMVYAAFLIGLALFQGALFKSAFYLAVVIIIYLKLDHDANI